MFFQSVLSSGSPTGFYNATFVDADASAVAKSEFHNLRKLFNVKTGSSRRRRDDGQSSGLQRRREELGPGREGLASPQRIAGLDSGLNRGLGLRAAEPN